MTSTKLITIKIAPIARQMLRSLAAYGGQELNEVVYLLARDEMRRLKIPLKTNGTKPKKGER